MASAPVEHPAATPTPAPGRSRICGGAFLLSAALLGATREAVRFPILLLDRFSPGWGWLEILLLAAYAAWVAGRMADPRRSAAVRVRIWGLFSLVFFLQLLIGLAGVRELLMTGALHLPVPAVIVGGPLFRGGGYFMPILFAATLVLAGPAWCSHLCYIGAWDDALSRRCRKPGALPAWARHGRWLALAAVALVALLLRLLGASPGVAGVLGGAFGIVGVGVIATASRRLGHMAHCTAYCPIGALANLLGKLAPWRVRIESGCTRCGRCTRACRSGRFHPGTSSAAARGSRAPSAATASAAAASARSATASRACPPKPPAGSSSSRPRACTPCFWGSRGCDAAPHARVPGPSDRSRDLFSARDYMLNTRKRPRRTAPVIERTSPMKTYPIPMVPGPVKAHPDVLAAYRVDYGSADLEPEYVELYTRTEANLRRILQTRSAVVVFLGEGMMALWGALKSCLAPGDRVLAVGTGIFGYGIGDMAAAIGAEVRTVGLPYDRTLSDLTAVAEAIAEFKPRMITAVHCETPSGTLNPLAGLG
ncbi:MAG TPA: 4Fe-4S binding protein, partial [Desulfobacterales bacterium]|nr:4Fe-4S binding protein [Desulfobacterales bacterium]